MNKDPQNKKLISTALGSKQSKPKTTKSQSPFLLCENLDKIGEVAFYYGFTPMKSLSISKSDLEATKDILEDDFIDDETENHGKLPLNAEEKIALIRTYQENNMNTLSQPVMLYFKDTARGARKSKYHRYADLEIIGSSGSIAEASLIQTGRAMLAEEGYNETAIQINSVGDRDSISKFSRELTSYYRKNINEMTPECRQIFKRDPFELLACHDESCNTLNAGAPRSMDFLSETSRRHLEDVLEYLEALQIPYTLNNGLIGNRKYCTETIFAIVNTNTKDASIKNQKILGIGVRYNGLAKRLNTKRDIQGVGLSLLIKESGRGLREPITKTKRPIASFIQLGLESKLLSLGIIEQLRQVKIPLYLSLAKDRLGAQVSTIEKYQTPYMIVMGKKEAVEKTVIVRKTDTHSQDIVPLDELAKYMKKIESQWFKK